MTGDERPGASRKQLFWRKRGLNALRFLRRRSAGFAPPAPAESEARATGPTDDPIREPLAAARVTESGSLE